ncbi:hypothetical protein JCM19298_1230 [Nonlabens ulvanivorans]|nr:hypothetical protein JCM19297_369 [Nonlabens ulvanivorans]GAK93893.1 hypothetical protein JCM19298_1230 [Nonlabens ulvanivorans]
MNKFLGTIRQLKRRSFLVAVLFCNFNYAFAKASKIFPPDQ